MTEELKRIYSSNTKFVKAYDTVELSHPNFSQVYYLVRDIVPHEWVIEDGTIQTFEPFGFKIQKPSIDINQQDMTFVFSNIMRLGSQELERASKDSTTPIQLTYRVYADDDTLPQTNAIILHMTNVVATAQSISGTASRVNLFQRKVPSRNFEPWIFKGLA